MTCRFRNNCNGSQRVPYPRSHACPGRMGGTGNSAAPRLQHPEAAVPSDASGRNDVHPSLTRPGDETREPHPITQADVLPVVYAHRNWSVPLLSDCSCGWSSLSERWSKHFATEAAATLNRAINRSGCCLVAGPSPHVPPTSRRGPACRHQGPRHHCNRAPGHSGRHSFVWLSWGHVRAVWS